MSDIQGTVEERLGLLPAIRAACPELNIDSIHSGWSGRFNHVVVVNGKLVFRFPRSDWSIAKLPGIVSTIRAITNWVSLPIPSPLDPSQETGSNATFMIYPLLPGTPLWRDVADALDPFTRDGLIRQLAAFLDGLHQIPPGTLGIGHPNLESRERWAETYSEVVNDLFPAMRPAARRDLGHQFEAFLHDPRTFEYQPAIRHGDPGPGNILFDASSGRISGILDFDQTGVGDPAVDWSIVLAPALYGHAFVERFVELHPVSKPMLDRGVFYRGTWPVREALRALKAGEADAFDREMALYR